MANMVSHIKRVARTNKPFRIASKYSDEVSSSSRRHRAGYIRSLATPLPLYTEWYTGDYGRRVWSPIEATTSKARTRALAAMLGHYRSSFYATFSTGVIFVSRLPPFPAVTADRRENCHRRLSPLCTWKSHVLSSNCSRSSLDTTTTTTTISAFSYGLLRK